MQRTRESRAVFMLAVLLLVLRPPAAGAEEFFRFKHVSMEHGLSNNSVFCILQDSLGFMWFGTFSGLNRFDGRSFTTYKPKANDPGSITGSVIFALLEDSRHNLWIGTDGGGLNHLDREHDVFSCYRHDPVSPESLSSDQVFALAEDREGWIWVGTGGAGLNRYDPARKTFKRYRSNGKNPRALKSDVVRCILETTDRRLWIGTAGGGLARYERATDDFTTYRTGSADPRFPGSETVRALLEDSKKRLWIGTDEGLLLFDPVRDAVVRKLDTDSTVRCISEDKFGRIWLGTESSGLYVFDAGSGVTARIGAAENLREGMSGDKIRSFFIDRSGLLWIGTRDNGINLYNPRSRDFDLVKTKHAVRQIYEDRKGRIWYGTDGGGLERLDPVTGKSEPVPFSKHGDGQGESVYTIREDGPDEFWIGTDGDGLYRFSERTGKSRRYVQDPAKGDSLGSNVVWALLKDSGGTLWVGTEGGGLCRYDPVSDGFRRYRSEPKDPHSLNGNSVRTILEDSAGTLWIGTWDGGLSRYRKATDDFEQFRRDPKDPSSLGDNSVNCLFQDREGTLWIGTAGQGLNRRDPTTGKFLHITKQNGLTGDNVFGILQDDEGFLWISTDNGLSRFSPNNGSPTLSFGEADGLQRNEFDQNAYCRSRSGRLYFGGQNGISVFDPASVRGNPNLPPVRITGATIYDQPVPVGRKLHGYTALADHISVAESIELSYKDAVVSFEFAVLDYTAPERNQYAMKIEGIHTDWIQLGNKNSAVITSMRPGKYLLRVKGSNNNGLWNEEGASLAVVVHPPFWETSWFRSLAVLGVLGFGLVVYKRRTLQLKRRAAQLRNFSRHIQEAREEERKAAAREVHDELGQYLAVLKMELYWLRNHLGDGGEVLERKTEEMSEVLDKTLDSIKSISSELRPKVLDNLSFPQAVRWLCGDFGRKTGIAVDIRLDSIESDVEPEIATNLFRVLQEILTNVLKHARASRVMVSLRASAGLLVLEVQDDGLGIPADRLEAEDSFGILGMRERCAYMGGSIGFENEGGTRVVVTVPNKEGNACSAS